MTVSFEDDLNNLELLSEQISDLIKENNFDKIKALDLDRKKIIDKIIHLDNSNFKNKISKIINQNNELIDCVEVKINDLNSNHNKFSKRLKFYSLSK